MWARVRRPMSETRPIVPRQDRLDRPVRDHVVDRRARLRADERRARRRRLRLQRRHRLRRVRHSRWHDDDRLDHELGRVRIGEVDQQSLIDVEREGDRVLQQLELSAHVGLAAGDLRLHLADVAAHLLVVGAEGLERAVELGDLVVLPRYLLVVRRLRRDEPLRQRLALELPRLDLGVALRNLALELCLALLHVRELRLRRRLQLDLALP